jgi:hypothetical protein
MDSTTVNFYLIFRGMPSNMPDLALLFNPKFGLNYKTPPAVYQTASGGGAVILEKYGDSLPDIH